MEIKPVEKIYFGTQLPRKQKDNNMEEYPDLSKKSTIDGLCEIRDFLADGCCVSDKRGMVDERDIDYFVKVIDAAKGYVLED